MRRINVHGARLRSIRSSKLSSIAVAGGGPPTGCGGPGPGEVVSQRPRGRRLFDWATHGGDGVDDDDDDEADDRCPASTSNPVNHVDTRSIHSVTRRGKQTFSRTLTTSFDPADQWSAHNFNLEGHYFNPAFPLSSSLSSPGALPGLKSRTNNRRSLADDTRGDRVPMH